MLILDSALAVVMVGFNGWNWRLAVNGQSTIEFWGGQMGFADESGFRMIRYGFKSYWDNLYTVFGTNKPLRMLSPSIRSLPLTGLEWSFF